MENCGGGKAFSKMLRKSHRSHYTSQNYLLNEIHSSQKSLYLFFNEKGQNLDDVITARIP